MVRTNKFFFIALSFTLFNGLCGLLGISLALNSKFLQTTPFAPVQLIILGAIFDFLDGKIAKMANSESTIGLYADSVCDILTFAVLPGILLIKAPLIFNENALFSNFFSLLIAMFYSLAGWARLVRFTFYPTKIYFEGFPSPAAALLVGSSAVLARFRELNWIFWPTGELLTFITVIAAILMVLRIPYPTPKRQMTSDTTFIIIAGIVVIVFSFLPSLITLSGVLFIAILYTILGPYYLQITEKKKGSTINEINGK